MSVFEELLEGKSFNITDPQYIEEVHSEIGRSRSLCHRISLIDPNEREQIISLLNELFEGRLPTSSYITPSFEIDCASRLFIGENVFANHGLTVMSAGSVYIDDGVMLGPQVGIFTVNHEPQNIRVIKTASVHIKKNAWIGARVNLLPGVTIGENAIVGTGSVVTHDIPDNTVAVGVPAKIIKKI